ncbi:methylenetetrahydrofolate reductase-domain-containing protein [Pyronema domesticum]|uniref:Similar to Methylenetetrahydrofolate reductase 1 acc. no. Q10258 n=1 Tax=Pyronema omphalodes (strain CBS 100304) TaxID=1076935 RepID=U4LTD0_PYROM|nr:methylenetetrahydrofolate reductase-domain-containing protein [Pyronema domesticum]CCX32765.1 Similar to Methylenetetrahydrofolate reductase 1; acc. no. Q10258 [Pyronema omphalodes CBS 100304]
MVHVSAKIAESNRLKKPTFSFEFYPPKTGQGVQNLYDRMDKMHGLGPQFIDITWNAGGRLSNLTCEMVKVAQSVYGLETCMHLTCTGMPKEKVDEALREAYKAGCTNILALRGDPPREDEPWTADPNGFRYAKDLVKHIRNTYGDYFDICVAGYPEGCEEGTPEDELLQHLKEKVEAGATFIITQMFYDVDIFLSWVQKCRDVGITVPIIPGIMPIHTYDAFVRRAKWTKCHVPPRWYELLEPVKNDDVAVREIGRDLLVEMCQKILDAGIYQLHFYTMNLATATRMVLEGLNLIPTVDQVHPPLPFRPSLGFGRKDENVRPIFWKHRKASYVQRTENWDEFPNGRWGDARSPAFGGVDSYGIGLRGSNVANRKLYGEPKSIREIANTFVRYVNGQISSLPWSESSITAEVDVIKDELIKLNERGFLTINSQPSVNGIKSSDPVYGWGPRNGYVYQKSYLELFVSPEVLSDLITNIERDSEMTYYVVDKAGNLSTNAPDCPNAVTWGVYPGKEIIQPTIVETVSFLAWKDEAYRLGEDWARCYETTSASRHLLQSIMDSWYLVNIVDNDFHRSGAIFRLFDNLEVKNIDETLEISEHLKDLAINGDAKPAEAVVAN